jgi:DNA helicase-2/ATP-dependent DNA helicase PcrA
MVGSYFEQTVADLFRMYERELHRMNAMDFDDLLVRAVDVLQLFQEVRDQYATGFRHVLVDEYQDTNHAQYRWLQLLAEERRNLMVVGDDAQCLVAGTPVTMADGSRRPIEDVGVGDVVRSGYGDGAFGAARVSRVHRSRRGDGVAITLRSGRRVVSTPEHTHFAGYGEVRGIGVAASTGALAGAVHNARNSRSAVGPGDISTPHVLMSRR